MFVEQGWPLYEEVVRCTVIHTEVPVHRDTVDADTSLVVLRKRLRGIAMPVAEKYKHCRKMGLWYDIAILLRGMHQYNDTYIASLYFSVLLIPY